MNPYIYTLTAIHPEWHTPPDLLDRFTSFLGRDGRPVVDYASSVEADHPGFDFVNTPEVCYRRVEDGLLTPDSGFDLDGKSFFLNPPGSRADGKLKYRMFRTLMNQVYRDRDSEMILLAYSINSLPIYTDNLPQVQPAGYSASVCMVRKRIQFIPSEGNPARGNAALAQNAILYLGQKPWGFRDSFSDLGAIFSNP